MFMATLLKIFPDARFIHIVRDPRDNVYSCMKAFGNMNIILNAMRWTKSNRLIENVKKKMPDKFATVLYEELAATPEPVMEKLCRFLGVQYNPGMIENTTPGWLKNVIAKGEKYHEERIHSALTGPLNTTNIGMWKSGLNEYEVAVTAKITGQYAKKMYGYDMNTEHNDTAKIPFFAFVKAWVICYAWIMINRIKYKSFRLNYIYFKYRKWRKGDKLQMAEYF